METTNLNGTWRVKVKSGKWWFRWFFRLFPDVKVIDGGRGYNVAWKTKCREFAGGIRWGWFEVTQEDETTVFTYDDYPIVDEVWWVNDDEFLGEFYWKGKYIGAFEMTRIISLPSSDQ